MTSSMECKFHLPLRACCDDGYGVLVDDAETVQEPCKVETQALDDGELDEAAARAAEEEEAREGGLLLLLLLSVCHFG